MLYTQIKNAELLFDNLSAETDYSFKIRSVNKDGYSDWSTFSVKTKSNPLEFAIKSIRGEVTAEEQEGFEISRLFDFAEFRRYVPHEIPQERNAVRYDHRSTHHQPTG